MKVVLLSERLGSIGDEERRIAAEPGAVVRSAALWTLDEIAMNGVGAAVIILGAVEPFDALAMDRLPSLEAIVRRGVGTDNVDLVAATERGIVVANVPDASVEEVSDHALALLLTLERRIPNLDSLVRNGSWGRDPSLINVVRRDVRRLRDLSLGIVGFGRIGRALARKAGGIYGRILTADPYAGSADAEQAGAELVDLEALLRTSHHISLHAALGPDTRRMIDDRALALMRPGTVLVNTARGGLIDEAALDRAVRSGRLGGVGMDVSEREPLRADDPLLGQQRTLFTAHSGMASTTADVELASRSVDAAIDLVHGRRPASVVNAAVWDAPHRRLPVT
jgi:D-3-phosphoglycerate dehydrogenase